MLQEYFMLIGVMVGAGLLGGVVNYLMTVSSSEGDTAVVHRPSGFGFYSDPLFYTNLVLGIAAALVVPVFLEIAAIGVDGSLLKTFLLHSASDDRPQQATAYISLISIGGFCVLAAISSRSFLQSLSSRILNQAREEAQVAQTLAKETQEGISKELNARFEQMQLTGNADLLAEEDLDQPEDMQAEQSAALAFEGNGPVKDGALSDLDLGILKALAAKPNTRRSIKGIRRDCEPADQAGYQEVRMRLQRLAELGYVEKMSPINSESRLPRWMLKTKGWAAI